MASASVLVLAIIATILCVSSAQQSYADSLLRGFNRRPVARGLQPRLGDPMTDRKWGGARRSSWGQGRMGEVIGNPVGQIERELSECRALRMCDPGYDCELNRFQDGVECVDFRSGESYPLPVSGVDQRAGGFGRFNNRNNGLNSVRTNVVVAGQRSSAWRPAPCCQKPRPAECVPQGLGAVSRDFWSFQNGQCENTPLLQQFVSRIGRDAAYGNFYPSARACMDKCDRPALRTVYAPCFQPRPAECVPPTDCQASLYSDAYFRYNVDSHQCERTQILNTHIPYIGQRPQYQNFFTDLDSCRQVCPQDAYQFNY